MERMSGGEGGEAGLKLVRRAELLETHLGRKTIPEAPGQSRATVDDRGQAIAEPLRVLKIRRGEKLYRGFAARSRIFGSLYQEPPGPDHVVLGPTVEDGDQRRNLVTGGETAAEHHSGAGPAVIAPRHQLTNRALPAEKLVPMGLGTGRGRRHGELCGKRRTAGRRRTLELGVSVSQLDQWMLW